jgi:hypothetical protein
MEAVGFGRLTRLLPLILKSRKIAADEIWLVHSFS